MRTLPIWLVLALLTGCFREIALAPETDATVDVAGDTNDGTDTADDTLGDAPDAPTDATDTRDDVDTSVDTADDAVEDTADADVDVEPDVPACEPTQEICDDIDNDCDEDVDEASATRSDPLNCGACGVVCEVSNASAACSEGVCEVRSCRPGWLDCDADPANGCETSSEALDSCEACAAAGSVEGERCGTCDSGVLACTPDGRIVCDGDLGDAATNVCGGCSDIDGEVVLGDACGTCDTGGWACGSDLNPFCDGDDGEEAYNDCGECPSVETCNVGDVVASGACGACGLITSSCQPDTCRYGDPECVEQFVCEADGAETESRPCGPCGLGQQTRSRTCAEDRCDWSEWSPWSECEGQGCEPGTVDTDRCGDCQQSVCTNTCTWTRCGIADDAECIDGVPARLCGIGFCETCSGCQWGNCRVGLCGP